MIRRALFLGAIVLVTTGCGSSNRAGGGGNGGAAGSGGASGTGGYGTGGYGTGGTAGSGGTAGTDGGAGSGGTAGTDGGAGSAGTDGGAGTSGTGGGDAGTDAPACTDVCTLGATQCSGTQVQTCTTQSNGCTDWSAPADCPGTDTCQGSACACNDQCTLGATQCSGTQVQTCQTQSSGCTDWSAPANCPASFTCSGSACKCTPGALRCSGNDVQQCNGAGTAFLEVETCPGTCSAGACTGACTPGEKRCNGNALEQCQSDGSTWSGIQTCSYQCSAQYGTCVVNGLDITSDQNLDGLVVVHGTLHIAPNVTVTSATGDLTIHADSISVDCGATLQAAASGATPDGFGKNGCPGGCFIKATGGGGGGHGADGSPPTDACYSALYGPAFGSATDPTISAGSRGGTGGGTSCGTCALSVGGNGGGVLRLFANTINVCGTVEANGAPGVPPLAPCPWGAGGGGGGSGGGILLAAQSITNSGTIQVLAGTGAAGNNGSSAGGDGAPGRIKLLYAPGGYNNTGTVTGTITQGYMPPLLITSLTHPDPSLTYTDGFAQAVMTWNQPWTGGQGYYVLVDQSPDTVPTAATGTLVGTESATLPASDVPAGTDYFHVVPIDGSSNVGTVQNHFTINVSGTPPTLSSPSDPVQATWFPSTNPDFAWTFPVPDASVSGAYYVFDQFANTVPDSSATFVPVGQKSVAIPNVAGGVHYMHIVWADTRGRTTTTADHYQIRVGPDPGTGTLLGKVTDGSGTGIPGASVVLNRGFDSQQTDSGGLYFFQTEVVGTWEVTVSKSGYKDDVATVTITKGGSTARNFTLSP